MTLFENRSIRRSLTLIIMMTAGVALLLAAAGIIGYEALTYRRTLAHSLRTQAQIIGANTTVALSFDNRDDAGAILATLEREPRILAAWILSPDGSTFASYVGAGVTVASPPEVERGSYLFRDGRLELAEPIELDGRQLGTIHLTADLSESHARLAQYVRIVAVVLVASILIAFWLSRILQRFISGPILELAETMHRVTEEGNYGLRVPSQRRDEIGELTRGFNDMLAQIEERDVALEQSRAELHERVGELQHEIVERQRAEAELDRLHAELVETSRRAGMSEVATGVLHNVGNALNTLNTSSNVLQEQIRASRVSNVAQVGQLLQKHEADLAGFLTGSGEGRLVPGYLAALGARLEKERASAEAELDRLRRSVEHIRDIVTKQQDYARVFGVREVISLQSLVEDALQLNEVGLVRHHVRVVRDFALTPDVCVERHRVLQILVNLISNAKYALDQATGESRVLTVRVAPTDDGKVRIRVEDNGVGIHPDNLTRIFAHGFTTKRDGHGFGLHSGALAAREMGGALWAESEGEGRGATFVLELPKGAPEQPAAASADERDDVAAGG